MTETLEKTGTRAGAGRESRRRCLVSRRALPPEAMVRFVIGPEGVVVPDVAGRLPGRGLWLQARRDVVETASSRNLFAKVARARAVAPPDLAEQVERLLRRRCLDCLSLARRAGAATAGFEKTRSGLARGRGGLVLAACDGAEGGRARVAAMAGEVPVVAVLTAAELGTAMGRERAVHVVIAAGPFAERMKRETARLEAYLGPTER